MDTVPTANNSRTLTTPWPPEKGSAHPNQGEPTTIPCRLNNRRSERGRQPPRFVVKVGTDAGKTLPIPKGPSVIGRAKGLPNRLTDKRVSNKHLLLYRSDGEVKIRDLSSSNGTTVNQKCISGTELLLPGDEIELGPHTRLEFRRG